MGGKKMNEYNEIQKEQELLERAKKETFRDLNGFSEEEDELIRWKHGVKNIQKGKCPICDKETTYYNSFYLEHTLCKDEYHVYSYRYVEGNLEEQIGGVVFRNLNVDSEEERKQYEEVLKHNREGYLRKINAIKSKEKIK